MSVVFLLIVTPLASFFLVGCLVKYAARAKLLDVPNLRSSHQIPTPLGGGVVIVLVVVGGWVLLYNLNLIPKAQFWGMFGASTIVGFLGLVDDFGYFSVLEHSSFEITLHLRTLQALQMFCRPHH